ncbi:DUF1905 domain-containing protein [Micromonospora humidisoli]|uniref:DUF1905 domain-containing protein n=1 Tax=Micromonospora humidisoli TaxID=2807622 RepID=A0ABS2JEK4_9ACTN|nr:DUF1905 domain-containing protein [Micromonospora humidisoli]MBM7084968.1 DUF1905 domain-containing protein [Micromonospora humidisoli]
MELAFSGELWWWKGPAPWHFVTVPDDECAALSTASAAVSYGWGMVPVKTRVRAAEGLAVGDRVAVHLTVDV